jgi:ribosomal protein L37AE/L43A
MSKEEKYECVSCHRTATVERIKEPPICCGKPMQKILREICLQPTHAEHARPMEPEDACDEFRSGD